MSEEGKVVPIQPVHTSFKRFFLDLKGSGQLGTNWHSTTSDGRDLMVKVRHPLFPSTPPKKKKKNLAFITFCHRGSVPP